MPGGRSTDHFKAGAGMSEPSEEYQCSECGFTHTKKKLFKRDGEGGMTCSTGHYTDKDEQLKRARNPWAPH